MGNEQVQPDYVYVIGGNECPRVKIGHSKAPEHRLSEFKTGFPYRMKVLWKHGGGLRLERALHGRFAAERRELEWFEFGDTDAVTAVTTAAAELWEIGTVDGVKRVKRFPTVMSLNGLLITYLAAGRETSDTDWRTRSPVVSPSIDASLAYCTAMSDVGQRCGHRVGDWHSDRTLPRPEMKAIETYAGWAVGIEIATDLEDLDRWLRQRCWLHTGHNEPAWCAPDWEEFDAEKHSSVYLYEQMPEWPAKVTKDAAERRARWHAARGR
ncbi:hypothetical protein Lesp02_02550 [Lentzea sp. NBRC 105346]|uniref:GIY-YIG nuclease family protein n=1 Tax=Lentzea sp. NBRC 105346 TaxID=3032205 RepID=UPI0024A5791A|nr:GIY-YIG nuclease family protein [Lentzea sp. NBRC 105346]GLZ28065.1 hypothetical protein Lesp02_02550 [Lentzea sp. NBRC 105346]